MATGDYREEASHAIAMLQNGTRRADVARKLLILKDLRRVDDVA
jgi:hypothetical protein